MFLATEFFWSDKPLDLLGTVTAFSLKNAGCLVIKGHPLTKEEILICCEDLRELGKIRVLTAPEVEGQIRKALAHPEGSENAKKDVSKDPDADEEGVLAQMEESRGLMDRKKKGNKSCCQSGKQRPRRVLQQACRWM